MITKLRHMLSWLLICAALFSVAVPVDARRKGSKAKTTATTKKKKSKSSKKRKAKISYKGTKKSRKSSRTSRRAHSRSYNAGARSYSVYPSSYAVYSSPANEAAADATRRGGASSVQQGAAAPMKKIKVEKPDLDEIRTTTLDPSSRFYFPKLKKKYEVNDTTMTPEEFRYYYLGYMFQEDFDPYRISPYASVTDDLRMKTTHTREEIDTITKYSLLALEDNPFDLRSMSFLVHVLKEREKNMRAKIWEYRLENLLGAIKSTGSGDSVENAWYVVYPMHEYDMVQLLGYEATDAQFIEPGYDYLTVRPDESDTRKRDKSAKGFYFNVMVPQDQYELKHPEDVAEQEPVETVTTEQVEVEVDPDDLPAE